MTAIFDSKMATDLAVADNARAVTTDGEIIVCTFKIYNFLSRLRKIRRKKRLKSWITSVVSHGYCQDNFYARRFRWCHQFSYSGFPE